MASFFPLKDEMPKSSYKQFKCHDDSLNLYSHLFILLILLYFNKNSIFFILTFQLFQYFPNFFLIKIR